MSDNNFKIISKDKRHRSSSSLIANIVEGTFSERKLNIRASIPEVEDHFAVAESRCDDLKEKLDLVKALRKQKRRLKKRSATRLSTAEELPPQRAPQSQQNPPRGDDDEGGDKLGSQVQSEHDPSLYISVHARPKKKVPLAPVRARRPTESFHSRAAVRAYVDPATSEQHRMLDDVRDYGQAYTQQYLRMLQNLPQQTSQQKIAAREAGEGLRRRGKRLNRADGDQSQQHLVATPSETACEGMRIERRLKKRPTMQATAAKQRSLQQEDAPQWVHQTIREERPVVELFNKNRAAGSERGPRPARGPASEFVTCREGDGAEARALRNMKKIVHEETSRTNSFEGECAPPAPGLALGARVSSMRKRRGGRFIAPGYELPTVASKMKQRGVRYNCGANVTSIPFIVSKSTAPSHNIGMNIQQVLNGLKMQQPISGIPLTIAHHMGLRHSPTPIGGTRLARSAPGENSLETHDINVIKLGRRLLRLPSYKYMSYGRLLSLYREGDGMVPRFLRAMSRPNYFYQSIFNLSARGDTASTLRRRTSRQEVKQTLAEYASLCREYEILNKEAKQGVDEATGRRLEELSRELNAREAHIRKVVTAYKSSGPPSSALRTSASTIAGIECVNSAYKLNTASEF